MYSQKDTLRLKGDKMQKEKIKCVVWDLDNTLWQGVLAEKDNVCLKDNVIDIIKELDRRGILNSICSKNDHDIAIKKLKEFGIDKFFLYPQINWNSKSKNIANIQKALNFSINTFAFVDDSEFERDEVSFAYPEIRCIDSAFLDGLLDRDDMIPRFVTEDSKNRRLMYQHDMMRNMAEEEYAGTKEDFLKKLNMKIKITKACKEDLKRIEELTIRTHQLNSTGITYDYEELVQMISNPAYLVLVAQLDDKYGSYGKIGIAVIEISKDKWVIKLLLMSCRVMSKGVGNVLLQYIQNLCYCNHTVLQADFLKTDRNRIMLVTYKFSGFKIIYENGRQLLLENKELEFRNYPEYIRVDE